MNRNNTSQEKILELTVSLVSSYMGQSPLSAEELPSFVQKIYSTLFYLSQEEQKISEKVAPSVFLPKPSISIKKSITPDYLICLEDGKKFKSLRRHLKVRYNLSPEQYRERWNLPYDYPMVAPNYAQTRSNLAKQIRIWKSRKRSP